MKTKHFLVMLIASAMPIVANAKYLTIPNSDSDGRFNMTLSRESTSFVSNVEVQRRLGSGAWSAVGTYRYADQSISQTLTRPGTYTYRARGHGNGYSGQFTENWTTEGTIRIYAPPAATPERVSSISRSPSTSYNGGFRLSWGNVYGATRYEWRSKFGSSAQWHYRFNSVGTNRSLSQNKSADGTYYYQVRACNSTGCGPTRETTVVVRKDRSATIATTSTRPEDGNFTITWDPGRVNGVVPNQVWIYENNQPIPVRATNFRGQSVTFMRNLPLRKVTRGSWEYYTLACYNTNFATMGVHPLPNTGTCIRSSTVRVSNPAGSPLNISEVDLKNFITSSEDDVSLVAGDLIADEIQSQLESLGLSLTEDSLVWQQALPDFNSGRCSLKARFRNLFATVVVDTDDSSLEFDLDSLSEPIVVSLDLSGAVDVDGKIKLSAGAKVFGSCIKYARSSVQASLEADIQLNVGLVININPSLTEDENGDFIIRTNPTAKMFGGVQRISNVNIGVETSWSLLDVLDPTKLIGGSITTLIGGIVEATEAVGGRYIDAEATDLANSEFGKVLRREEGNLQVKLNKISGEIRIPYGSLAASTISELVRFIDKYPTILPTSYDFIKDHEKELIYALFTGDDEQIQEILGTSAACEAGAALASNMRRTARPSDYQNFSFAEYCDEVITSVDNLGNPDVWDNGGRITETPWFNTPGTTLNIGAKSISNNYQPYTKRATYKTINETIDRKICFRGACRTEVVPVGHCKLEMRVYKKSVNATNLKPLIALHGGSWRYRGGGFVGMETQISHYTEQGFVVFAPFYRLVGENGLPSACQISSGDQITEDVVDALEWVDSNKSRFGATGKVRLVGQSAGAHLSNWLLVNRPNQIEKALLLYPATDFGDLLRGFKRGDDFDPQGVNALMGYLNVDNEAALGNMSGNESIILNNSFPSIIARNPSRYPDIFALHGVKDSIVPSSQSERLCSAYFGDAEANYIDGNDASRGGDPTVDGTHRVVYQCGSNSWLDLFAEGEHILDMCILPGELCESGSSESEKQVERSITDAIRWLNNDITRTVGPF